MRKPWGIAPVTVENEQQMLDKVANTPNAIGYLNNEFGNENIRIFDSE